MISNCPDSDHASAVHTSFYHAHSERAARRERTRRSILTARMCGQRAPKFRQHRDAMATA